MQETRVGGSLADTGSSGVQGFLRKGASEGMGVVGTVESPRG